MKKYTTNLILLFTFFSIFSFGARLLDVDQFRSSDRVKLWTLPTDGLIASSGTLEVSNGTSTLTNKSISLGANTLTSTSAQLSTALSDETGSGAAVFGTGPTLSAPLISTISNTGTLTLPTSTDTLVGRATTDTLTNKTVSGGTISGADIDGSTASNTSRLTLPKAAKTTLDALTRKQGNIMYDTTSGKPYYDTGSVLKPVGSGSGGEKNYLTDYNNNTGNGDIELGATTGWALGHGAVDSTTKMLTTATFGSGASGNLSIGTVGGSSALAGSYSLSYTSSAATTAGDFLASDAFTIDPEDKAKPLRFQFNYMVASGGTFATWSGLSSTNSFQVALYDVTNSQLIQPSGNATMTTSSGSLSGMGYGEFQTSASGTQYRLIVYNANATTGAIQLNFDSFKVGLNPKVYGSPITDTQVYSGTLLYGTTAATNITSQSYKYSRSGDKLNFNASVKFNGAANANGTIRVPLPSGLTIDTSKNASSDYNTFGYVQAYINSKEYIGVLQQDNTATTYLIIVRVDDSGATAANWAGNTTAGSNIPGAAALTTSDTMGIVGINIPITGWSSSVQMSDTSDSRVVAAIYEISPSTSNSSFTDVTVENFDYDVKIQDTHGAVTTGASWKFTAPISGLYRISANMQWANKTNYSRSILYLYKNGSQYSFLEDDASTSNNSMSGTSLVSLNAGDYIDVRGWQDDTASAARTITTSANRFQIAIERVSGPSQTAASESVSARYTTSAGQSITNGATPIVIDFGTKDWDTHGAVTTGASWKFTAPISGKYSIKSMVRYANSLAWTQGNAMSASVYKNGSLLHYIGEFTVQTTYTATSGPNIKGDGTVNLLAGDYVDIRTLHGESAARALVAAGSLVWVSIDRVGN
jgi:hypothetical protein